MYPVLPNLAIVLARQRTKGGGRGDYESTAGWDWGWRVHPVTGAKESWHNGVDLSYPGVIGVGTPIHAPWDGEIIKVFDLDPVSGNAIRVEFSNSPPEIKGASFAHLNEFAPGLDQVGAQFLAGDVIGYMGSTGRSTGAHLHLTFWGYESTSVAGDNRIDIDPLPYLDQATEKKILGMGITGGMLVSAFIIFMILRKLK